MAKPSEKYSIVPQALRDKFREYKKKERTEDMKEGEASEETSSKQDREALRRLIENNGESPISSKGPYGGEESSVSSKGPYDGGEGSPPQGAQAFRKGGMVRKPRSGRGDGCAIRGFTKGRMY